MTRLSSYRKKIPPRRRQTGRKAPIQGKAVPPVAARQSCYSMTRLKGDRVVAGRRGDVERQLPPAGHVEPHAFDEVSPLALMACRLGRGGQAVAVAGACRPRQ